MIHDDRVRKSQPLGSEPALERADACNSGLERSEQVDRVPIRILYLRVALLPDRVPWLLDARGSGINQFLVDAIDIVRRLAQEGDPYSRAAGRWRPLGSERLDRFLRVEEQAEPAGQHRLDVPMSLGVERVGELEAELPVERDRYIKVGHDHTDGVELWHRSTVAPGNAVIPTEAIVKSSVEFAGHWFRTKKNSTNV